MTEKGFAKLEKDLNEFKGERRPKVAADVARFRRTHPFE